MSHFNNPDAELWACPDCGHRFVTKNMWHSCSNYSLEYHFVNRSPAVRAIFNRFLEVIQQVGPVTVIPQKTRIAIQAKVRFAGGVTRKQWFLANLWLTRRARHPKLRRIEEYGPGSFGHQFRFDAVANIDGAFEELVREAYAVGMRKHLEEEAPKGDLEG